MNILNRSSNRNAGVLGCLALAAVLTAFVGLTGCGAAQNGAAILSQAGGQIIGGTDANGSEGFSKTLAAIYNVSEGSLCTASILSDTILVTAAHCVDGPTSSLRVVFGTDFRSRDRIVRAVNFYEVSPLWPFRQDEDMNSGDIAVVHFSGGLPPGYHSTKVLRSADTLKNGESVVLAGYGQSNGVDGSGSGKLRYVSVEIENVKYSDTEVLLDQRHGRGACHGDSGGPAYVKVNGEYALWGVTNRGVNDPENNCSVSAAYANVTYWSSWIVKTAGALNVKGAQLPKPNPQLPPPSLPGPSTGGTGSQRVAGF